MSFHHAFASAGAQPRRRAPLGLQVLRWADELGFSEAWIGEHHTAPWEPHPSPDLLVAQALMQPSASASAPAASCCPIIIRPSSPTASPCRPHRRGRLNSASRERPAERLGALQRRRMSGVNRDMTREALDIILPPVDEDEPSTIPASSGR